MIVCYPSVINNGSRGKTNPTSKRDRFDGKLSGFCPASYPRRGSSSVRLKGMDHFMGFGLAAGS